MKNLFKFLLFASLAIISTASLKAQSLFSSDGSISYTTTTATTTNVDTMTIAADEAGIIRVTVIGYNSDSGAVTGSKIVRYNKKAGTLTLGTPTASLATVADTNMGSATWSIAAVGNNICVTVTGISVSVRWKVIVERTKIVKTS